MVKQKDNEVNKRKINVYIAATATDQLEKLNILYSDCVVTVAKLFLFSIFIYLIKSKENKKENN